MRYLTAGALLLILLASQAFACETVTIIQDGRVTTCEVCGDQSVCF